MTRRRGPVLAGERLVGRGEYEHRLVRLDPAFLRKNGDALMQGLVPKGRRLLLHLAAPELHRLVEERTRLVPVADHAGPARRAGGLALLVTAQKLGLVHRFEQINDLLPQASASGRAPGLEDFTAPLPIPWP